MSEALVVGVVRQAIETAIIVSLPMLLAGLVAGVLVSIFQTVTSIQDNVLAFIPRAAAIFARLRADVSLDAAGAHRLLGRPDPAAARVHPVIDSRRSSRFALLLVRPGMVVMTGAGARRRAHPGAGEGRPDGAPRARPAAVGRGAAPALPRAVARRWSSRARWPSAWRSAFALRALIAGAEFAGHLSGQQIGFSYGATIDPQSGVRNTMLATLYGMLATLGVPRRSTATTCCCARWRASYAGAADRRRRASTRRCVDVGARHPGAGLRRRRAAGGADRRRAADRRARDRPDLARRAGAELHGDRLSDPHRSSGCSLLARARRRRFRRSPTRCSTRVLLTGADTARGVQVAPWRQERTEKPTAKRLKDARKKGQVARSRDLARGRGVGGRDDRAGAARRAPGRRARRAAGAATSRTSATTPLRTSPAAS